MTPRYERNTAKVGEIHGTVNLGLKRSVHEGYTVLSNYIFELLEVNRGVAGFSIQLHPEDVDAVLQSVTAHAEKVAGMKTTLYVG